MSYPKKKLWPSFSFSTKGIGGMNSWATSVFARPLGKMIDGDQICNAFPASDVPPGKLLIEESSSSSSIEAGHAADNSGEGKDADIQGFPKDDGFERRDRDALVKRIDDLEKELYDYQYHMGLLLIEKKTRAFEIEELRRGLAKAKANVKPECSRALQDQELQSGRESLVVEELKYKLNKLRKQNDVLLAQKNEVEDDKRKFQKDKENLNMFYNGLQNLHKELIRKRDRLLSLPSHCTTCETCSIILNETYFSSFETLGAKLGGDIQNESHALFSTTKRSRPRLNKRRGSMKAVAMEAEGTLEGNMKEIKKLPNGGSEDLEDDFEERKLSLVDSDKKQGNGEKQDLLSHASGATKSSVPGNERHHKRQKTSDIGICCCHGQKHYNLRPSTILKVSISQQQNSEHTLLERDSDADFDYEPANSD